MARIGYARVSTKDQNMERQLDALQDCEKVFAEQISGKHAKRKELKSMLAYIREGDIIVVTELDRLGRNSNDLTNILDCIRQKGASIEILNLPSTVGIADDNLRRLMNNVILELYKYFAQAERERIKERQKEGIRLAKTQGKYKGRKPKYTKDDPRLMHAFDLYQAGHTVKDIERMTGVKRATFYRYTRKYKEILRK